MRKRLNENEKRSIIIGVKVNKEMHDKIKYLSNYEDLKMSTYIFNVLEKHIRNRTKYENFNWDELFKEGREENG